MLKSTSRLGSDRAITDITLTATIIRTAIAGRTIGTAGSVTTVTIIIIGTKPA